MSCCDDSKDWHPHCGMEWHKRRGSYRLAIWVNHNEDWTWLVRAPRSQAWKGEAISEEEAKARAEAVAAASEMFDYYVVERMEGRCVHGKY